MAIAPPVHSRADNTPRVNVLAKLLRKNRLNCWYYRTFKSDEQFTLGDRSYDYFYHRRNRTWLNERTVEIPVAWDYVTRYQGRRILEVGNVLSHYFRTNHDVVDKYERARGVVNQDIVDFSPSKKYDLIVTVSTLEHVGWDEQPRDVGKIPRALEHLRGLLTPGGQLVVTMPLGYNDYLDEHLRQQRIRFDEQRYLQRVTADNRWREVDADAVRQVEYGAPYLYANALVFGIYSAK